jgi:hypothetical protein
MPINAAWHARHRMPRNPTEEERLAWHLAHQAHCACRQMPPALLARLRAAAREARAHRPIERKPSTRRG